MLVVAYEGTNYCGWQIQPNGITIQEVLSRTVSELFGQPIQVMGASRTDAGVHALGNVAAFRVETRMPADKIAYALNQRLPEDIRVQSSREVPEDFHPRFSKSSKTYEYKIQNRRILNPLLRRDSYFYHHPLDEKKMQEAAEALVGEHDFTSFASIHAQTKTYVRKIYECRIWRDPEDLIHMRIRGNGFLYNMVRIIAGTLIQVGAGMLAPEEIRRILNGCDRNLAGPTAPPEGLTLIEIAYEDAFTIMEQPNKE
jgi:tRNA pseudouridine38-40 synthase